MRIGLCATMSCGKTTLVKALSQLPEFKDYYIATERSKYLRDLGVKLNTDSTIEGQYLFMGERSSELFHENLLTDRTIWDVSAFTLSAESIKPNEKQTLVNAFMLLKSKYDYVFYISPEGLPIENNGIRETNPQYRELIDFNIKSLLSHYPPRNLVQLSGTIEQRVQKVKETLSL